MSTVTTLVQNLYEDLPYPPRNPEEEKQRLIFTAQDGLDKLNYYGFSGKETFTDGFRVLVAGGGTGDATIYLGEQLQARSPKAEIIHLDLSTASLAIAEQRAAIRKLTNIRFIHGSLLDVKKLNLGMFDYINCSGVLHHLEDPKAGLLALKSVLKPQGVMGLMLYGRHARMAIYQVQELMELLNSDGPGREEALARCKSILGSLPSFHYFRHAEKIFRDHQRNGDAGIADMFLHPQDRAYSVPEVYEYVESCGMTVLDFLKAYQGGTYLYDINTYVKDPEVLEVASKLPLREQYALGELLSCTVSRHIFYVSPVAKPRPEPEFLDHIPSISIPLALEWQQQGRTMPKREGNRWVEKYMNFEVRLPAGPHVSGIFSHINGERSIGEILNAVLKQNPDTMENVYGSFLQIYRAFRKFDWIFLRAPGVPAYSTLSTRVSAV